MATAAVEQPVSRGGYPLHILPPNMDTKYMCSHCKLILRDPVQCFCGHRFCQQCLHDITSLSESVTCSSCQAESSLNEYSVLSKDQCFPDNALKREMFNMLVTCPNQGCGWKGKLRQYAGEHEASCEHVAFICDCGMPVLVSQTQTHKDTVCSARALVCSYCSTPAPASQLKTHYTVCPKFPVSCGRCHQSNIPRDTLMTHLQTDCPNSTGQCQFGCTDEINPQDMDAHMAENVNKHLTMIGARMTAVDGALRSPNITASQPATTMTDLERRIREIELNRGLNSTGLPKGELGIGESFNMSNPQSKLRELLLKVSTFEGIVTVLKDEQERCINLIEQAQMQNNTNSRRLEPIEAKIAATERELELRDARITELESRLTAQETVSYDGQLIWKITEFSKRRREAISMTCTSIYSPSFFTQHTGYKMCTRLYPNGDGMGKDKYVSLFFVVMRGQYDALLPWPFRQKVTFMLLDQIGRDHISDAFRPDPSSSSFRRPASEMNIASGCPMFVKLEDLDRMATNYVKDDVMFIKIIVAPLDP